MSQQEKMFTNMERAAVESYRESQRIRLADPIGAKKLLDQANALTADAKRGRALYREEQTSYTPTQVPQEEVMRRFEEDTAQTILQAPISAKEQHGRLTEHGMTKNLTIPAKLSIYSDNIVNPDEVGPDEYIVGQVANTVVPTMANATVAWAKAMGQSISNVMPDEAETHLVEAAKKAHYDIVRNPWFKKAEKLWNTVGDAYDKWAESDPKKSKLFEETLTTAAMIADRTGVGHAARYSGGVVARSGARLLRDQNVIETIDLLSPVKPKVVDDQHKWDTSGKTPKYLPDENEIEAARVINTLKGFDPQQAIGKNRQIVQDAKAKTAERLEKTIMDAGNPLFSKDHVFAVVGGYVDELRESTGFRAAKGDTGSIEPILENLQTMLDATGNDARSLLQLRRDFDKWADNDVGLIELESSDRNKIQRVVRQIRNTLNAELIKLAPDAPVEKLLRTQTSLYTAGTRLSAKYDARKTNLVSAINNGLYSTLGVKLPATIGALAALGGMVTQASGAVGGLGVVAGTAGSGIALYQLQAALRSPKTRKHFGNMVVGISKGIKATVDPIEKSMMRADRALILEMLSETEEEQEK